MADELVEGIVPADILARGEHISVRVAERCGMDRSGRSIERLVRADFLQAAGKGRRPAALLLHKAAGDRRAYEGLARALARRGISSLRLDLRGHGESINAGKFVPGGDNATAVLEGTEADVVAGLAFLEEQPWVDKSRLAVVGASYSGEAMAAAARQSGRYAKAYVALSPGSFSAESAAAIDRSGAEWLLTRSARERSPAVKAAVDGAGVASMRVQTWVLEASGHATDVLAEVPGLTDRIADWIGATLNPGHRARPDD